jgi:hypothetical protein
LEIKDRLVTGDSPTASYFYDQKKSIDQSASLYAELVEQKLNLSSLQIEHQAPKDWIAFSWDDDGSGPALWEGMNEKLRKKVELNQSEAQLDHELTRFLKPIPSIELISFRGISLEPGETRKLFKRGKVFIELGFMAATLNPWKADQFLKEAGKEHLMIVLRGRSSRPVFPWVPESHRDELEVVFMRGSRWIVEDVIGSHEAGKAPNVIVLSELMPGEKVPKLPAKTTPSRSIKWEEPKLSTYSGPIIY